MGFVLELYTTAPLDIYPLFIESFSTLHAITLTYTTQAMRLISKQHCSGIICMHRCTVGIVSPPPIKGQQLLTTPPIVFVALRSRNFVRTFRPTKWIPTHPHSFPFYKARMRLEYVSSTTGYLPLIA